VPGPPTRSWEDASCSAIKAIGDGIDSAKVGRWAVILCTTVFAVLTFLCAYNGRNTVDLALLGRSGPRSEIVLIPFLRFEYMTCGIVDPQALAACSG
jgi:hypothetical protein